MSFQQQKAIFKKTSKWVTKTYDHDNKSSNRLQ